VRYTNAVSFRTALETRLKTAAASSPTMSVNRLRKLVALERFLARLLEASPLVDLTDYFNFSVERVGRIDADQEGAAIRFRLRAEVAGRQFETVVVDVGFGGALAREPDLVDSPGYLAFAELAPIPVPTLPLDLHVAEKVHAYTRRYGGTFQSSRVKDLVDLALVPSLAEFDAGELRHALELTFGSRASHPLPTRLPLPPEDWVAAYRNLAAEVALDPDVTVGHQIAATFLDPVLTGEVSESARWDPAQGQWHDDYDALLDRTVFRLDDDAYSQFNAMLDDPREPSDALRKLLNTKAPWE
jgi:hypothetical protein